MKSKLKIKYIALLLLTISAVALYSTKVESPVVVEVKAESDGAVEDPRIQEYLNSEEANIKARIHIAESDKVDAIAKNKENLSKIPKDSAWALKEEQYRHAMTMYKINRQLDELKKSLIK